MSARNDRKGRFSRCFCCDLHPKRSTRDNQRISTQRPLLRSFSLLVIACLWRWGEAKSLRRVSGISCPCDTRIKSHFCPSRSIGGPCELRSDKCVRMNCDRSYLGETTFQDKPHFLCVSPYVASAGLAPFRRLSGRRIAIGPPAPRLAIAKASRCLALMFRSVGLCK